MAHSDTRGLEHSKGNKGKTNKETKSCERQAESDWMRVATSYPSVRGPVSTLVAGPQKKHAGSLGEEEGMAVPTGYATVRPLRCERWTKVTHTS